MRLLIELKYDKFYKIALDELDLISQKAYSVHQNLQNIRNLLMKWKVVAWMKPKKMSLAVVNRSTRSFKMQRWGVKRVNTPR